MILNIDETPYKSHALDKFGTLLKSIGPCSPSSHIPSTFNELIYSTIFGESKYPLTTNAGLLEFNFSLILFDISIIYSLIILSLFYLYIESVRVCEYDNNINYIYKLSRRLY